VDCPLEWRRRKKASIDFCDGGIGRWRETDQKYEREVTLARIGSSDIKGEASKKGKL